MLSSRDFLIRGLLAGLLAGLFAFGVAYVAGEPSVNAAIAIEEAGAAAAPDTATTGHSHEEGTASHSHDDEGAAVSRGLQSTLGLLTATAVYGTVMGGLMGIVNGLALGRFGRAGARATTLGVTAAGFIAVYAVPFLIYPPNPPAVGSGDTIGMRTGFYFATLAISVMGACLAVAGGKALLARFGGWYASLIAVGGYLVVMVITARLVPHYNEVSAGFPAQLLFDFRMSSLLTQIAFWSVLGVVLAELVGRLVTRPESKPAVRHPEPAAG